MVVGVSSDGQSVKFIVEDSGNCGGTNRNEQSGTATATIEVVEMFGPLELGLVFRGRGELEASGYEELDFVLDGTNVFRASSKGLSRDCDMGPQILTYPSMEEPYRGEPPYILSEGTHTFRIQYTTDDSLYHFDAFSELSFIFTTSKITPQASLDASTPSIPLTFPLPKGVVVPPLPNITGVRSA